jgi:CheY-like chemotaxis protein
MQVFKHPSVLVADDSEDTRELLRYWLETKRCRVLEAMNGQEAVARTRDDCPDLILMHLNMPVLDGLDAARRIREEAGNCDVPIVCMTSYPTKETQANALAAGCNWFISHPIDFVWLGELLETLLPAPSGH